MNADKLKNLDQFSGGDCHYRNTFGLFYTEGVRYLADHAEDRTAVVTCRADTGRPPAVTQMIPWSNFPLPSMTLWVEGGVLLLPSEH